MANTYLYGASGHGKVIKDILNANGIKVEAFVDDNPAIDRLCSRPVVHDAKGLSPMIVSIGNCQIRKKVVEKLLAESLELRAERPDVEPLVFATAIHPKAVVSDSAEIGEGTVVMAGAVINADAKIGKHCIINTGATVDHECVIEDYCHIAPGVNISGCTHVGEGTWIGVGACVIQEVNIGRNCFIGAGAVVINDIEDNMKVVGVPAKPLNTNRLGGVNAGK